jgi:hypothetical protein
MIIYFTLTTDEAVYFQVNKEENLVRVTKMILKSQCPGEWHRSTLMTVDATQARASTTEDQVKGVITPVHQQLGEL